MICGQRGNVIYLDLVYPDILEQIGSVKCEACGRIFSEHSEAESDACFPILGKLFNNKICHCGRLNGEHSREEMSACNPGPQK